mgnify:CR=1 FL=1
MGKDSTAKRLKKIMGERNLRQIDILKLTEPYCKKYGVKMNKSDISQYCSGKTEPNQEKLFVLGEALNVNEAWLMGFNVPMERYTFHDAPGKSNLDVDSFKKAYDKSSLRKNRLENHIIENMDKMNNEGKKKLLDYSEVLLGNPDYAIIDESILNAAHTRADIAPTPEGKAHDDAIMDDDSEWE